MLSPALSLPLLLVTVPPTQGFVERALELGLHHEIVSGFDRVGTIAIYDWAQSGVAVGDLDGDGDLDVVACGGVGRNSVFLNVGGAFVDVSLEAGIETGDLDRAPCLGDYDGDGDLDLFLGALERGGGAIQGAGRLYRNDGNAIFEEVTDLAGTFGFGRTIYARWDDLDRDGLLDLHLAEFLGTPNAFYRNNGDGTFTEMGAPLGLDYGGSTHVVGSVDTDGDRLPDVIVCNDHAVSLWGGLDLVLDGVLKGLPDHTFLDVTPGSGLDTQGGLMGVSFADVNYDGLLDIYKTDVKENWLFINQGWPGSGQAWTSEAAFYGVENATMPCAECASGVGSLSGWACPFLYADKDPWVDLLVVNGKVPGLSPTAAFTPRNEQNFLFTGDGPSNQFRFTDSSAAFGLHDTIDDRGAAIGDLDADGDIDVLITPCNGRLRYYENQIDPSDGNWVGVRPVCNTSAPGGVGVEVRWTDQLGFPHVQVIGGDGPTASQNENYAYFGLGAETAVDLSVRFPSGVEIVYSGVPANTDLVAVEPKLLETSHSTLPIAGVGLDGLPLGGLSGASPLGYFSVTAYAHDAAGNPLDASAAVSMEVTGLVPLTGVLALGENTFRRYFEAPVSPGSYRAAVSFDGFAVGIEPQVHFYDPSDASGTTAILVPEAVRAGSADTVQVRVAPKTADGIGLGPSRDVTLTAPGLTALGCDGDLGDGRYRFDFPAPAVPGAYSIGVLVDGIVVDTLVLEVGGVAVSGPDVLYWEKPIDAQAVAPHQARLGLLPLDAGGRRLGPETVVALTFTPSPRTPAITLLDGLWPKGRRVGDFLFVLEKPPGTPQGGAKGTMRIVVDGTEVGIVPYSF